MSSLLIRTWVVHACVLCAGPLALAQPEPSTEPPAEGPSTEEAAPANVVAAESTTDPPANSVAPPPTTTTSAVTTPSWASEVYQRVHASVVRVASPRSAGSGFVFQARNRIATAFHVVAHGRRIRVTNQAGTRWDARIIGVDRDADLAILEVDGDVGEPLTLADPPEVGRPVLAVGHPLMHRPPSGEREGLLGWSLSRGVVSAVGPRRFQFDANVNPGNSGGPVVDSEGRAVGVVVEREAAGIGIATRSRRLEGIGSEPADEYRGRIQFSFGIDLELQMDEASMIGAAAHIGLTSPSGLGLELRGGVVSGAQNVDDDTAYGRHRSRGYAGLLGTYAVQLYPGIQLEFGLGARVSRQQDTISALELAFDGCDPTTMACEANTIVNRHTESSWLVQLEGRVILRLADHLSLGYSLLYDPVNRNVGHALTFGIGF